MSNEKRNEVTEEVKEEARKLSEEDLEKVSGGVVRGLVAQMTGIRLELEIE